MENQKRKSIFGGIKIGIRKGWTTPTLPENIIRLENLLLVRIFRFLGGISILSLLGNKYLNLSLVQLYILLLYSMVYFIYSLCINIIRLRYMYKKLKSGDMEVRNSPRDMFVTALGKVLYCAKGVCNFGSGIGQGLGVGLGLDALLEYRNKEPIFKPYIWLALDKFLPESNNKERYIIEYIKERQKEKELQSWLLEIGEEEKDNLKGEIRKLIESKELKIKEIIDKIKGK